MRYCDRYFDDIERVTEVIAGLSSLKGSTVYVTGASGLIGSAVSDILLYLNQKYEYDMKLFLAGRKREKITERFSVYEEGIDYKYREFDALGTDPVEETCDFYIHCASNAAPAQFAESPAETLLMNIYGVKKILEAARRSGGSVLFVSSSEVYGINEKGEPFTEEDYGYVDILNPRACYPAGKRAAETLCSAYFAEYGVRSVIVRPGHIYGPQCIPSDNRAASEFARNAAARRDIVMKSKGTQLRSYCYSMDCASAILAAMINGESGNAYNISNRNSIVTISDLAEECARAGEVELIYEEASEQEKKSFNLMPTSALNAQKLEDLGWKALFDLEEGIEHTVYLLFSGCAS